ncbi:hypothetical protein BJF83_19110 [Nocardiopsis sp. CNR-923]|uniref:DUF202 domain-containing protein n=1 Tax=Nocardiopsis sp. CNR-923 TaxID=1904965 RepID=UPI00095BB48C|nr:DUF202 domain-containing protein [Nocardiopsis sp. CNR-923]OLT27117.1 hypothetical protein BJF83_19110 [Nocardiopsis sp. CNR-923]
MTAADEEDRAPGLQPERTLLSWQRTLILVVVVGVLYMRGSLVGAEPDLPVAPPIVRFATLIFLLLMCCVLGLHLWYRWRRTGRGLCDPVTGRPPLTVARPWALVLLCVGVLGLSVVLVLPVLRA